ncbi:MAG TPA: ribosome recycling factor [Chloroflexota bacterium]|nr:ribosome recycling factor [Chloroflexota bacterium]
MSDKVSELVQSAESKMQGAIEHLKRELATVRTGRASPNLLDRITVDYFGVPTPINAMANVSAPEPRLLVIAPWDKRSIGPIEKAILKSDIGINPNNDGKVIRLAIPQLTEERRREMTKIVKKRTEEGRVALRNVRRDVLEDLKKAEKEKLVTEDDVKRGQERLQKLTDIYITRAEETGSIKEQEIMEF